MSTATALELYSLDVENPDSLIQKPDNVGLEQKDKEANESFPLRFRDNSKNFLFFCTFAFEFVIIQIDLY
ncbi:MAG: hypothetical protein Q4C95_01790 [Planctomycetia bacterium]|nr:hypothetical protein [Planctomycetia bacterium]